MIKLPNWLVDKRLRSLLSQLEISEVDLFEWKNKTEAPALMTGHVLNKEEFNSILKGGIPVIQGKVQIFYIKDQYSPTSYNNSTSRFKYHLMKCGTITQAENSGRANRYVTTNKLSNIFSVNLVDNNGNAHSTNVDIEMNVCLNCLKKVTSANSPIQLTKPKKYPSNHEWSKNFELKAYFNQAQRAFGIEKKKPLQPSLFGNSNSFTKPSNGPSTPKARPTSIAECSECGLGYPEKIRSRFKHYQTDNDDSICIRCYSYKYGALPEGVSFNDQAIANKALRQLIKPRQFRLYKIYNLNTERILFLGIVKKEDQEKTKNHPDIKPFTGNKPVKWFLENSPEIKTLSESKKGDTLKLYSQEIKVRDILN